MPQHIHYSETDLHLYKVLWDLRHTPDLFSAKLERQTKSGKAFSLYSRFDANPSYGEVNITYLVIKAGIHQTRTGLAYMGGSGYSHARCMVDRFLHFIRNILVEHEKIPDTEQYVRPASVIHLNAMNFSH